MIQTLIIWLTSSAYYSSQNDLSRVFKSSKKVSIIDCHSLLKNCHFFKIVFETFYTEHFSNREFINDYGRDLYPKYNLNRRKLYDLTIMIMSSSDLPQIKREFYNINGQVQKVLREYDNSIDIDKGENPSDMNSNLFVPLRSIIDNGRKEFRDGIESSFIKDMYHILIEMEVYTIEIEKIITNELNQIDGSLDTWKKNLSEMDRIFRDLKS